MTRRKTHCPRGHERTPDNLTNHGQCRTCFNAMRRDRYKPNPRPVATHCRNGHERTPENVNDDGRCRTCRRQYEEARTILRRLDKRAEYRTTHCKRGHEREGNMDRFGNCCACRALRESGQIIPPEIEAIRHEYNVRGIQSYIARRRARGVPVEGRRVA